MTEREGLATAYGLSENTWQLLLGFRQALRDDLEDTDGKLDNEPLVVDAEDPEEEIDFRDTARGESVQTWAEEWQEVLERLDTLPQSPDEPDETDG